MCGIAGTLDLTRSTTRQRLRSEALGMADRLAHRGPDDRGCWVDEEAGVALAHRRLAVIDLSPAGSQPMRTRDGRWTIVFNGEIYNFRELRAALNGHPFRGHSDTEVLLAAVAEWGLETALTRANGMFAFALWDARDRRLQLCRDRIGEKPLYYVLAGRRLLFASQLRALTAHPSCPTSIDRSALASYFRHSYVPGPRSILEGVRKLPPGTVLTVPADGPATRVSEPAAYWSYETVVQKGLAHPDDDADPVGRLDALLQEAVSLRTEADVPLGAFLSGGVDSSLVVALLQRHSRRPVRTFTVGMESPGYDEAPQARAIADYLGTDHTEITVTPEQALAAVPRLACVYDEPFADPSQVPTLLIAEVARRHVTVALSGDGGDEVFGGYNRYVLGAWAWRRFRHLPRSVRRCASAALTAVPPHGWDHAVRGLELVMTSAAGQRNVGDKVHKLAALLPAAGVDDLYDVLRSTWPDPAGLVGHPEPPAVERRIAGNGSDPAERMMLLDGLSTLPDDMLVKVDRASMAVSLEVRVPLLDHRVVEYAWRLPSEFKVAGREGKRILRRVLARHVPPQLWDRPKMGFDPPVAEWLRGPLRAWAEDLLSAPALRAEGLLDAETVARAWREHLSGRRNHDYRLWAVLMFRSWHEAR